MANARPKEVVCRLIRDGTLKLEANRRPWYNGIVVSRDMLIVTNYNACTVHCHRLQDGKLLNTHKLESEPRDLCLINDREICVILLQGQIVIISVHSTENAHDIIPTKTLHVKGGLDKYHGVVTFKNNFIVCGVKDNTMCWSIVSRNDEHCETIHQICKGEHWLNQSHLCTRDNMIYISCSDSRGSPNTGVYGYDSLNPNEHKYRYNHKDLTRPRGITIDKYGFIFVCNGWPDCCIHHLTDKCEIISIYTETRTWEILAIFCDQQYGYLFVTCTDSNEIGRYRPEYQIGDNNTSEIPIINQIKQLVIQETTTQIGKNIADKGPSSVQTEMPPSISIPGDSEDDDQVSYLPLNLQDKKPSELQLGRISMKIAKESLPTDLKLGLSLMDMQQIQKEYTRTVIQCFMILLKWQKQNEEIATFRNLEKEFQLVGIDVGVLKVIGTGEPWIEEDMFSSLSQNLQDKILSESELDELSTKLGEEFLLLGLELGLSWVEIEQILRDYSNPDDQCLQTLVKWQKQSEDRATFRTLEKAFQIVGIDVGILKAIGTGIPMEILKMDKRSIQLFQNALQQGKEKVYSIRVMVVGHFNVGKTTLIKRLLGEDVNISERHSTEGIDVHVHCCDVSVSSKEWTHQKKDSEQQYRLQRLLRVLQHEKSTKDVATDSKHNANNTITEQLKIAPYLWSISDTSRNVIDENVLINRLERIPDSDANIEKKEQTERTLDSSEEVTVISKHEDAEVLYRRFHQTNFDQNISSSSRTGLVDAMRTDLDTDNIASPNKAEYTSSGRDNMDPMLKLLQESTGELTRDAEKIAPLAIWDFAGQYAFYTTHQTFLTRRAIYLMVSDVSSHVTDLVDDECYFGSEGKKECTVHELNEVWLNSIHSCASLTEKSTPPVILVGTHVDKISQSNRHEVCERYFNEFRNCLKNKPTIFHLIDENFAIDNTIEDNKLEDLKRKIVEVASQQPYWGEEMPARWLPLEQELMLLKTAGIKLISRKDVENINMKGTVPIENSDELDLFLRFLHETGTIIYFRENVVLDPKWLIDAQKLLINARPIHIKSPDKNCAPSISLSNSDSKNGVTQKWSDFREKGILTLELVDAAWTLETNPELHDNRDHLLLLMEQLNIISKPKSFNENGEKVEDFYLTPCMLRQESPVEVISPEHDPRLVSTSILCWVFTDNFLPPPIFHRLLAACVSRWPVAKNKETSEYLIFCGCCVFDLGLFHRLTLYFKNHVVFARITKMVIDDVNTPDAKVCSRVRKFITLNLFKITSYLGQNLKYDLRLECPISQIKADDGRFCCSPFHMWFADEGHDPDAPIMPEHMNYARLCVAVVTVCGSVLREILLTHVPPPYTNIYQAILASKDHLINKRQARSGKWLNALLTYDQSQVVFQGPYGCNIANVDNFDISLLYILIRNVSSVPPPAMIDWGFNPPDQPRDRSLGASVERIRLYRNEIVGHSMDGLISAEDFDKYWNMIDTVLQDVEDAIHRKVFREQLERHKRQVISIYEAC